MQELETIKNCLDVLDSNNWDSRYPYFMKLMKTNIKDLHHDLVKMVKVHDTLREDAERKNINLELFERF